MINPILNKGGAGVSMTREATVERINPIIEAHVKLNHRYNWAIDHLEERPIAAQLEAFQKIARADVGKLNETVFSAGGVAYNGTQIDPGDLPLDGDDSDMLFALLDYERDFLNDMVEPEFDLKPQHQIRSLAILGTVRTNSAARLDYLKAITQRRRRSARSQA